MEAEIDGKLYSATYSQELQKEQIEIDKRKLEADKVDAKLKRILIVVLVAGLVVLLVILGMLALLQFRGGHLGYIIKNLVC